MKRPPLTLPMPPKKTQPLHVETAVLHDRASDASAMKEFEELRRKNLRLQSDLLESLKAIEEDNISIETPDSSPSFHQTTPRSASPLSRSMGALLMRGTAAKSNASAPSRIAPRKTSLGSAEDRYAPQTHSALRSAGQESLRPQTPPPDDEDRSAATGDVSARYSDAVSEAALGT